MNSLYAAGAEARDLGQCGGRATMWDHRGSSKTAVMTVFTGKDGLQRALPSEIRRTTSLSRPPTRRRCAGWHYRQGQDQVQAARRRFCLETECCRWAGIHQRPQQKGLKANGPSPGSQR